MQQSLFDLESQERWIENKRTAKTGFLNLAMAWIDRELDIDMELSGEGISLEDLRRAYPRPENPRKGNGYTDIVCSDCGREGEPLQLNPQRGWLCKLCHREYMVAMGYEDEYGRLLPQ